MFQIANHLTLIKDPNSSKVTSYIRKTLAKNKVSMGSVSSAATTTTTPTITSTSSKVTTSGDGDRRRGKQGKVSGCGQWAELLGGCDDDDDDDVGSQDSVPPPTWVQLTPLSNIPEDW